MPEAIVIVTLLLGLLTTFVINELLILSGEEAGDLGEIELGLIEPA